MPLVASGRPGRAHAESQLERLLAARRRGGSDWLPVACQWLWLPAARPGGVEPNGAASGLPVRVGRLVAGGLPVGVGKLYFPYNQASVSLGASMGLRGGRRVLPPRLGEMSHEDVSPCQSRPCSPTETPPVSQSVRVVASAVRSVRILARFASTFPPPLSPADRRSGPGLLPTRSPHGISP